MRCSRPGCCRRAGALATGTSGARAVAADHDQSPCGGRGGDAGGGAGIPSMRRWRSSLTLAVERPEAVRPRRVGGFMVVHLGDGGAGRSARAAGQCPARTVAINYPPETAPAAAVGPARTTKGGPTIRRCEPTRGRAVGRSPGRWRGLLAAAGSVRHARPRFRPSWRARRSAPPSEGFPADAPLRRDQCAEDLRQDLRAAPECDDADSGPAWEQRYHRDAAGSRGRPSIACLSRPAALRPDRASMGPRRSTRADRGGDRRGRSRCDGAWLR